MRIIIIISIVLIAIFSVSAQGPDLPKNYKKKKAYDYIVEMPDFMEEYPRLGSDDIGVYWEWWSKDGDIRIEHSMAVYPREIMDTTEAMEQAVEAYRGDRIQNYSLLEMSPKFIPTGGKRYLYQKNNGNDWEIAIAEETPNRKCTIAVFWFHASASNSTKTLLRALRSGGFEERGDLYTAIVKKAAKKHNEQMSDTNGRLVIELHHGNDMIHKDTKVSLLDITRISREWVIQCEANRFKSRLHLRADKRSKTENIKAIVKAAADGGLSDVIFGAYTYSSSKSKISNTDLAALDELGESVKQDPEAAAKKAENWLEGPAKKRALIIVAERWAIYSDPAAAAAWVEALPVGESKTKALEQVAYYFAKKDLEATLEWAVGLPAAYGNMVKPSIAYAWSYQDPKAAANWIESWQDEEAKAIVLWILAINWADTAPQGAAEWVENWPDGESRNRTLVEVAGRWSIHRKSQDAGAAAAWVDSWPEGAIKNQALIRVLVNWTHNNYKEAAAWIDRWPEGETKTESLILMAGKTDYYEPQWVADWVNGWSDGKYKLQAYQNLTNDWVSKDPVAAVEWAESLPEGKTKIAVYTRLAGRWFYEEGAKGATRWIENLPDGVTKLAAVQGLVLEWVSHNAPDAENWVKSLPEGEIKYEALKEAAKGRAIMKNMPTAIE